MDIANPVVQLCIAGTRAEYAGKPLDAAALYRQAWDLARDDIDLCIAAHYVARFQPSPEETLRWNLLALEAADRARTEGGANAARVQEFYPSLYLSLGRAYEMAGDAAQARRYYAFAEEMGFAHDG